MFFMVLDAWPDKGQMESVNEKTVEGKLLWGSRTIVTNYYYCYSCYSVDYLVSPGVGMSK